MTAIARIDVASPAKPEATDRTQPGGAPQTTPEKSAPTDFAKQLQKATKPVVKKPTIDPGDGATPAAAPETSTLAQIIATIINTGLNASSATAPDGVPQTDVRDPKLALAGGVGTATPTDSTTPETTQDALLEQMVAVKPEAAPQLALAEPPLTPLEQAIHDMLSEVAERKQPPSNTDGATLQSVSLVPQPSINGAEVALEIQHAAPIAHTPPQELVSQNHAHLVIDDPNGRVVMTVAIRGNDVNVTVRASDDATAAALARNAGSLEEAMRGRGLQLAQFDSQRDLARDQNGNGRDKPTYQQRENQQPGKPPAFTLEENS